MNLKSFDKFNMSENDTNMAKEIVEFGNQISIQKAEAMEALSSFYLAKQIECSAEQLSKSLDDNRVCLILSVNSNVNNMIESNKRLAESNEKQAKALNRMTLFLVILTVILVIMTGIMLFKMFYP